MSTHRNRKPIELERLELRQLLSASVRSYDGSGNNLVHTDWGSVGEELLRKAAAAYADGISAPGGVNRPSAREISNVLSAQDTDVDILNSRDLSAFIYAWGQFIDHDLDLTNAASPAELMSVLIPSGDPYFDPNGAGDKTMPMSRSVYDVTTGSSTSNPRQQVSIISAWLDGSMVYGSDAARAAALRMFVGGLLKTSDGNLMPFNTDGLANANDAHIVADSELFLGGDVRANENVELTSLQTLFVREHNRLAAQIAKANPRLTDEQIYQQARALVGAEIQSITYNEWLPALMGSDALTRYRGYNPWVNPNISSEFSTAAFRVGHSMIGNDVEFLDNDGEEVADEMSFTEVFFNPPIVSETGIDPILKYLASDRMQEVDTHVVNPLRNFLFGPPGSGGFDLASLNIERGRDHGLADYNTTRAAYGLGRVTSFAQITSDPVLQGQLVDLYGSVDNIDLWVGGLSEDHLRGSSLGPTFQRIIADQFQRLRDGDRFWFERQFSGGQLFQLEHTSLADIIKRNTTISNLQGNVFFFVAEIRGTVFLDRNGNGRQDRLEPGVGGITVQLLDEDGNVQETARTNRLGNYSFDELDLGSYTVQAVAPASGVQLTITGPAQDVEITRGMVVSNIDFAAKRAQPAPTVATADLVDPLAGSDMQPVV